MANDFLAIWRDAGLGRRLHDAALAYLSDYVMSTDNADHEPTEFERMMMEDMLAGMFSDKAVDAILQEAARGMKAGGMDPEGPDGATASASASAAI